MLSQKRRSAHQKNSSDQKPWEDAVLRDLYAVRDAYAAEHGHDLERIYRDLKRKEERSSLRRSDTTTEKPAR